MANEGKIIQIGSIHLSAHQLVSAKLTERVCLTAQKFYKSGQIEQIEKK
ncbi:hypothetical protein [Hoylesella oralis]|nr:hypothetical protein [Hoylesella oralis]EPH19085.1 hypothetical protein HMPREF1475_00435 [Hoylesella oralis HGA0225]